MTWTQYKTLERHLQNLHPARVGLPLNVAIAAALARIDELEAGVPKAEPVRTALVCPACGSGNNFRPNPHTRPGTRQCNKCGHQWEEFEVKP